MLPELWEYAVMGGDDTPLDGGAPFPVDEEGEE